MPMPKPNVTKSMVIAQHLAHPDWGATRIAHHLGCNDAYVRATAARNGLVLPKSKPGDVPSATRARSKADVAVDRELLASAQMRDRIAARIEGEADRRDQRTDVRGGNGSQARPKARLLRNIARSIREIEPRAAIDDPRSAIKDLAANIKPFDGGRS